MPTATAPSIEFKTLQLDAKAASDAGTLGEFQGYASTWSLDQGGDRIQPGAFAKSLAARRHRPLLLGHDHNRICGVEVSIREDRKGLLGHWRFTDTAEGRDARTLVRSGALTSMSIGYVVKGARKGTDGARELLEIDLFECSLVSLPMNTAATILDAKSGAPLMNDLAERRARLEQRGIISLAERPASLGRRVVADPAAKSLISGRSERASVFVPDMAIKTLTSVAGTVGGYSDQTSAGTPAPTVLSLLPQRETSDSFIQVPRASVPTGAAAVGPATATTGATGLKPEVVVGYSGEPHQMATVAGWLAASRNVLSDGDALAELIDSDLRFAVLDALEAEVLAGSGTAPSMLGVRNWPGVQTLAATAGQDVNALSSAIGQVVTISRRMPTVVAVESVAWAKILASTSAPGFTNLLASYGITMLPTAGLPAGEALVGAGSTAVLYVLNGVAVTAGTVADDFVRNVVRLRCEVRAVVVVSKPAAWVRVSGLGQ